MSWLLDGQVWVSLLTLTGLEIVLGIDNLIFLSILAGRLPPQQQASARRIGLVLALGARLALLGALSWLMGLTAPWFSVAGQSFSGRDVILVAGGLFLMVKGGQEIRARLARRDEAPGAARRHAGFMATMVQITLLDIVFSLDSVITAVGMANRLPVMAAAVVIAVGVMLVASGPLAGFVQRHPTVKMLALAFLVLVGLTLVADGTGLHIPKAIIYAAIGFSVVVELLNQVAARRLAHGSSPA